MTTKTSQSKKTMLRVHRALWEETEDINELTQQEVEDVIFDVAGGDQRTQDKYIRQLKRRDRIKPVENTDKYIINNPREEEELGDFGGEYKSVYAKVPAELKTAAENAGINFNGTLIEGLMDKLSGKRRMFENAIDQSVTYDEAEYMFQLLTNNHGDKPLFKKHPVIEEESKAERTRMQMYEDIFGNHNEEHRQALRKAAYQAADSLGLA